MDNLANSLTKKLIEALRILPGIGPKSAARMAFHLLQRDRSGGIELAKILTEALTTIHHCERCRNFTEHNLCQICLDTRRETELLCIVASPFDIEIIENTHSYHGRYFALRGLLSPLDSIGPNEIGIQSLANLLHSEKPLLSEVIIATNPTIEGEATAHYLAKLVHEIGIPKCSRLAHGLPYGGELEYTDTTTLIQAFTRRIDI